MALFTAVLMGTPPAFAQQPVSPTPLIPPANAPMNLAEYQGVSCAITGAAVGLATVAYLNPIEVATATTGTALLLVPVMAAGFAVGCSVGATLSPAFLWAYRHLE